MFETTQRITEKPLKRCPTCNGAVHRIISHTSFVLKGSGWYATDYARSNSDKSDGAIDNSSSDSSKTNGSATADSSSSSGEKSAEKAAKPAAEKSTPSKAAAD